jgi:hypothetical protein
MFYDWVYHSSGFTQYIEFFGTGRMSNFQNDKSEGFTLWISS